MPDWLAAVAAEEAKGDKDSLGSEFPLRKTICSGADGTIAVAVAVAVKVDDVGEICFATRLFHDDERGRNVTHGLLPLLLRGSASVGMGLMDRICSVGVLMLLLLLLLVGVGVRDVTVAVVVVDVVAVAVGVALTTFWVPLPFFFDVEERQRS